MYGSLILIAKAIKPENSEETNQIAVDYFALGVIVFEFMLGYVPFFFLLSFCFFFYKKRDPISEDQDKKSERQSLLKSKLKKANCLMLSLEAMDFLTSRSKLKKANA